MVRQSNKRNGSEQPGGTPYATLREVQFVAGANRTAGGPIAPMVHGAQSERYVIVDATFASIPFQLVLTSRQAVAALQTSPRTLWELTDKGEILHVRIGRRVYYRLSDLNAYLASNLFKGSVPASSAIVDDLAMDGTCDSARENDHYKT